MATITIDDREFQENLKKLQDQVMPNKRKQAVHKAATEILRLSAFEVPHDKGLLQNSGNVEDQSDHSIVGYNKVYAARLHEHPEYRFQKGRKGKYLEDPIKKNLSVLLNYIRKAMQL